MNEIELEAVVFLDMEKDSCSGRWSCLDGNDAVECSSLRVFRLGLVGGPSSQ